MNQRLLFASAVVVIIGLLLITRRHLEHFFDSQSNEVSLEREFIDHIVPHPNCSETEAHDLARYFISSAFDQTQCPTESWLLGMRDADPSIDKIIIDIGFNKGYNYALWTSVWLPQNNMSSSLWHDALQDILKYSDCGACGDCKHNTQDTLKHNPILHKHAQFSIIGLDINNNTVNLVNNVTSMLAQQMQHVRVINMHGAASNEDGIALGWDCGASYEGCNIVPDAWLRGKSELQIKNEFIEVHRWTVDSLITHLEQQRILSTVAFSPQLLRRGPSRYKVDILKIDTEGNDAMVLQGARHSLQRGRVRVVIFEYHVNCPWSNTTLESVVRDLDNMNYECYFEGTNRLWLLSGCWHPLMEIRKWANVICAHRNDKWVDVLRRYTVSAATAKDSLVSLGVTDATEFAIGVPEKCTAV